MELSSVAPAIIDRGPVTFEPLRGDACLEVTVRWEGQSFTAQVENDAHFGRRGEIRLASGEVAHNQGRFAVREDRVFVVNMARNRKVSVDGRVLSAPMEVTPDSDIRVGPFAFSVRLLPGGEGYRWRPTPLCPSSSS